MRIVHDYPPMFDEINQAFNVHGKGVIFAWGSIIYNPQSITVPAELITHEAIHGKRQGSDIEGWWHRYIDDEEFRFIEEIHAHHAEYAHLAEDGNRRQRRRALKTIANRLASPLYGKMTTPKLAKKLVLKGPEIFTKTAVIDIIEKMR